MLVNREDIECKGHIRRKHSVKLYLSQKVPRQKMTSAVLFAPVMFISVKVSVSRKNTRTAFAFLLLHLVQMKSLKTSIFKTFLDTNKCCA